MTNWMTAAGLALIAGGLATLICFRSVLFGGGGGKENADEQAVGDRSADVRSPRRSRRAGRRAAAAPVSAAPASFFSPEEQAAFSAGDQATFPAGEQAAFPVREQAGYSVEGQAGYSVEGQAGYSVEDQSGFLAEDRSAFVAEDQSVFLAEDRAVFLAEDQVALPGEPMPLRAMPMAAMPVDAMPAEAMQEATPVGREGRRVRSRRGGRRFAERAPVPVEAEEDHVGGLAEIGLGSLDLIEVEEPVLGVEEPAFEQVLAPEPVVAEPGATEPISAEPIAFGPIAVDPIAVGPIAAGPIMAGPNAGDPITAGPITAEPMVAPVRRRRVDRSDRGYGDRVDGWIRPEYHEEPIEPPSGEYWTPVPMELDLDDVDPEPSAKGYGWPVRVERLPAVPPYEPATGFDLTPVATEPTEVVPSWPPLPGELRRPGVWPAPDGEQEAVDRPDLVVVGDTRADDRLGRRRSRREESARAWARRDEQARAEVWPINPERRARGNARDRTAKDRRADDQVVPVADRGWREEPYQEPERSGDWPAWSDPPAAPPVRRRPRPRPRPHQDVQPGDGNVYQSRHAAEPPR